MSEWERPKPSNELEKLETFIGEWISEDIHYPMPWMSEGGKGKSRNIFRKALDGYCFLADFSSETPFGTIKGHGIWFFDSKQSKFKVQWYDNFANHLEGEGNFLDVNTLVIQYRYCMGGQDILERHTSKIVDADNYDYIIETFLDGEFRLTTESKYHCLKRATADNTA